MSALKQKTVQDFSLGRAPFKDDNIAQNGRHTTPANRLTEICSFGLQRFDIVIVN